MNNTFQVFARNNLTIPCRIAVSVDRHGHIRLAVCNPVRIESQYETIRICNRLPPKMTDWSSVGKLTIKSTYHLNLEGRSEFEK